MTRPVLHHVGIVVPDVIEAAAMMAMLDLTEAYRGYVPEFGALCIFSDGNGGSPVEFVVPDTGSVLARFNKGMGGLHHLAYVVPSLDDKRAELADEGMALLEATHVKGAGDFYCNFLSPIYTRGLTVEFVELIS